jgi:hypothetical protein
MTLSTSVILRSLNGALAALSFATLGAEDEMLMKLAARDRIAPTIPSGTRASPGFPGAPASFRDRKPRALAFAALVQRFFIAGDMCRGRPRINESGRRSGRVKAGHIAVKGECHSFDP